MTDMHPAFRSRPTRARAFLRPTTLALGVSTLGVSVLASACNAGHIRDELGQQIRQLGDRLRGASPRERYAHDLAAVGDSGSALSAAWLAAGDRALGTPAAVLLPLREQGTSPGTEPIALAWRMRPRRGERVTVQLAAQSSDSSTPVFTELWREDAGNARTLVASGEGRDVTYDVPVDERDAVYVLRLQPTLRDTVRWHVTLGVGPSLAFPVAGRDARAIESGWGAARDGGARPHEGVDIMAPRGTPALAAEDGVVGYVGDDRLGGRVVSLAAPGRGHSLYYAHLDRQAVHAGQLVHAGDTLGFVGTTGNARGGPPHLHFGVYASGSGAVDPAPYLEDRRRIASTPGRDTLLAGQRVRTGSRASVALRAGPGASASTVAVLPTRAALVVDGVASGGWLHVRTPEAAPNAISGYVLADAVDRAAPATVVSGTRDGNMRLGGGVDRGTGR